MREEREPWLSGLTTLRLGGRARALITLERVDELPELMQRLESLEAEALVVGRLSNILPLDGDLPLVLVRSEVAQGGVRLYGSGQSAETRLTLVSADACVPLARLLRFCAEKGLTGLEGLSGIPGSVGGAVAMNAGSFGCETCARLFSVTVADKTKVRTLARDEFSFGYRSFSFPGSEHFFLILSAVFALESDDCEAIRARMQAHRETKRERQPVDAASCGCVFKNPQNGPSAGQLLEAAGFRGKNLGGVGFSSLHANFLVHHRELRGTSSEAIELIRMAKDAVQTMSGIVLEPEVRIVPWTPL